MQESKEITLEIQDLSRSGPGLGRDKNGRVVFVPFTAPGDIVRVEIVSEEKRYAEARILEIVQSSPARIKARCPVFGSCGGCDWQHLSYDKQWETKLSGISHALKRVGVDHKNAIQEIPAEQIWNYRNRVQLRGFEAELGFYAKGSNRIIAIQDCAIARTEINVQLPALREEGLTKPRAYKVEVEVMEDASTRVYWNAGHAAGGFRQIHDAQNAKLQGWVEQNLSAGNVLLDLYGGQGNLSLGLSNRQKEIHCVDVSSPSTNPDGTPENFQFYRSAVLPWLLKRVQELKQGKLRWAAGVQLSAVIDPPREGLDAHWLAIITSLQTLGVTEILAIGCETDAWARDVNRYTLHGWELREVAALDLFPQTHHIEALAVLRKI